jgi:hypothetical protein
MFVCAALISKVVRIQSHAHFKSFYSVAGYFGNMHTQESVQ